MVETMIFDEFNPLDVLAAAVELSTKSKSSRQSSPTPRVCMEQLADDVEKNSEQPLLIDTLPNTLNQKETSVLPMGSSDEELLQSEKRDVALKLLTMPSSTTSDIATDDEAGSSPLDSASCDLHDHSYAGNQLSAMMMRQATDDDDGYSSRSSVDSPCQGWRTEENDIPSTLETEQTPGNVPMYLVQQPAADGSPIAYLLLKGDSGAVVPVMLSPVGSTAPETQDFSETSVDTFHSSPSNRLARRMSAGSEMKPVQIVAPFISRRRATTDGVRLCSDLHSDDVSTRKNCELLNDSLVRKNTVVNCAQSNSDGSATTSAVTFSVHSDVDTSEKTCQNLEVVSIINATESEMSLYVCKDPSVVECGKNVSETVVLSDAVSLSDNGTNNYFDNPIVDNDNNMAPVAEGIVDSAIDNEVTVESSGVNSMDLGKKNTVTASHTSTNILRSRLHGIVLHPLVDHDYCTFAEFSAEIQSSIIATTDIRQRTERKNNTKSRLLAQLAERNHRQKFLANRNRKVVGGRLMLSHKAPLASSPKTKLQDVQTSSVKSSVSAVSTLKADNCSTKRRKSESKSSSKTGLHIQDQFVYFSRTVPLKPTARQSAVAEKKLKSAAADLAATNEPTINNNVFDWYKNLAKIDKGREFGSSERVEELPKTKETAILSSEPLKDSEVIDMVYEMMPKSDGPFLENGTQVKVDAADASELRISPLTDSSLAALFSSVDINTLFPNGLADLDDISDSDLLQSDYSSLASLLNELSGPSVADSATKSSEIVQSVVSKQAADAPQNAINAISVRRVDGRPSPQSVVTPPELVMVSMYWNDLPGLVIGGQQYIRLVDIHRQVLPAKETAILKKRCQMFGFDVINCTDMQRDFLIRYANAAKSKSTWIVSRQAADKLIGFYIDPRIKNEMEEADRQAAAATTRPAITHGHSTLTPTNFSGGHIQRAEVIQASKLNSASVTPRPGVPCVIVRDVPRTPSQDASSDASRSSQYMNTTHSDSNFKNGRREQSAGTNYPPVDVKQVLSTDVVKNIRKQLISEGDQYPQQQLPQQVSKMPRKSVSEDDDMKNSKTKSNQSGNDNEHKPLSICHKDNHRSGYRGRFQGGYLFLELYVSRDAACVQCDICMEMMNLRKFLKHMHRQADPDQLIVVTFPQKFELYNFEPTSEEIEMWAEFERKQKKFDPPSVALMKMLPDESVSSLASTEKNVDSLLKTVEPVLSASGVSSFSGVASEMAKPKYEIDNVKIVTKTLTQQSQQLSVDLAMNSTATPLTPIDGSASRHSLRLKTKKSFHQMEDYEYPSRKTRRMDA